MILHEDIGGIAHSSSTVVERSLARVAHSGMVAVDVSLNGFDFSSSDVLFEYQPIIELHAVYPKHGPILGGTRVVLRGKLSKLVRYGMQIQ